MEGIVMTSLWPVLLWSREYVQLLQVFHNMKHTARFFKICVVNVAGRAAAVGDTLH